MSTLIKIKGDASEYAREFVPRHRLQKRIREVYYQNRRSLPPGHGYNETRVLR